eukprot:362452-Chlamydomonas_euryale.AAC.14
MGCERPGWDASDRDGMRATRMGCEREHARGHGRTRAHGPACACVHARATAVCSELRAEGRPQRMHTSAVHAGMRIPAHLHGCMHVRACARVPRRHAHLLMQPGALRGDVWSQLWQLAGLRKQGHPQLPLPRAVFEQPSTQLGSLGPVLAVQQQLVAVALHNLSGSVHVLVGVCGAGPTSAGWTAKTAAPGRTRGRTTLKGRESGHQPCSSKLLTSGTTKQ